MHLQRNNQRDGPVGPITLQLGRKAVWRPEERGMDGTEEGEVHSEQQPLNRWQRTGKGSQSAKASARWGTQGHCGRGSATTVPSHTWNAYQTQSLGPPRVTVMIWPKVTVKSLVGLVLKLKRAPCFMPHPSRPSSNDSLVLICIGICIVSLTLFLQVQLPIPRHRPPPTSDPMASGDPK